ncbi:hypothetical protein [uncultured Bacteroides sp.]|uniref:hypothetical protein n=1 Tax=uncultured Bacteroides sp. TaxID=162156 RepID=UPI002AAAE8BE|nr:hypothetical protein [uncultured Bacteroides sp.]
MKESITAYQGKSFHVTLQSYLGSTNYGWCLLSLPKGIILAGQANEPVSDNGRMSVMTNQMFFFIPTESSQKQVEIDFGLCRLNQEASELNPFKYEEKVTVMVSVVPANTVEGSKFVKYTDNAATYSPATGHDLMAALKYGYPCDLEANVGLKYGYPCAQTNYLYGYPCSQDSLGANLKYGYPCSQSVYLYGYPCNQDNLGANVKYGYPCGQTDTPVLKYGYPNC